MIWFVDDKGAKKKKKTKNKSHLYIYCNNNKITPVSYNYLPHTNILFRNQRTKARDYYNARTSNSLTQMIAYLRYLRYLLFSFFFFEKYANINLYVEHPFRNVQHHIFF